VLSSSALASGRAVTIGTPYSSGPPSVAVDSSGGALVAWADTKDLAGAGNLIQYCVIPLGAASCAHSGNLTASDSAREIDDVSTLVEGSTMIILADVFGAAGDNATDYEPGQEWQSSDGGATWTAQNSGLSVASGIIDADTEPIGAVILPGTDQLGFGWVTADGPPTFNAFPSTDSPECSRASCPAGFATLEPPTNPDMLSNEPGQFASISGGSLGAVMGVFDTLFTNGPLGCAQSFGTGFVYGSGNQSSSNNYNISPGQPNTAWKVPVTEADCDTEYSAVGGGPSGFGILEDDLATKSVDYHRFDVGTTSFDTPRITVNGAGGETDGSLSQDGAGGIYATYLLGGPGGPLTLSYSADGGRTFANRSLESDSDAGISQASSSVAANGQGWAAWTDNGSVLVTPFVAADAVVPATVGASASTSGSSVALNVTCATYPCTLTITLTASETVVVHAARAADENAAKKHRTKLVSLGTASFVLGSEHVRPPLVKLSEAGKAFLRTRSGRIHISAKIVEIVEHVSAVTTRTLTLRIHHPAKKR
jgi:hypothetical protein